MRVRPLAGGIEAWQERGYPVEPVTVVSPGSSAQQESVDFLA